MRSLTYSTPTEIRASPSVMPSSFRCSGGTEAWVIEAGWLIKLSTPPRLSAKENTVTANVLDSPDLERLSVFRFGRPWRYIAVDPPAIRRVLCAAERRGSPRVDSPVQRRTGGVSNRIQRYYRLGVFYRPVLSIEIQFGALVERPAGGQTQFGNQRSSRSTQVS